MEWVSTTYWLQKAERFKWNLQYKNVNVFLAQDGLALEEIFQAELIYKKKKL